MEKTLQEAFAEKANLIYEFDKRSPLFVRKADREINSQNIEAAVTILKQGLGLYPQYATAHILLGKALTLLGRYNEATESFQKAVAIIESPETLEFYLATIEEVKKLHSPFTLKKRTTFLSKHIEEVTTAGSDNEKFTTFEDRLPDIASQLFNARKIAPAAPSSDNAPVKTAAVPQHEPQIVSETLAKIHLSQGNLQEALGIYRLLLKQQPGKASEIKLIIEDLQNKISAQG